jgi:hypothetical protein
MRSELGKECRKLFRKMMAAEFPEYREDKGQIVPQGWYVLTYPYSTSLFFYIMLVAHHSRDEFTTEGGWEFDGNVLPRLSGVSEVLSSPAHIRVGELWAGKDYWWPLVLRLKGYERALLYKDDPIEHCLPLVAPAVRAAAQKLKEHLVPVFGKIIQMHGGKTVVRPTT